MAPISLNALAMATAAMLAASLLLLSGQVVQATAACQTHLELTPYYSVSLKTSYDYTTHTTVFRYNVISHGNPDITSFWVQTAKGVRAANPGHLAWGFIPPKAIQGPAKPPADWVEFFSSWFAVYNFEWTKGINDVTYLIKLKGSYTVTNGQIIAWTNDRAFGSTQTGLMCIPALKSPMSPRPAPRSAKTPPAPLPQAHHACPDKKVGSYLVKQSVVVSGTGASKKTTFYYTVTRPSTKVDITAFSFTVPTCLYKENPTPKWSVSPYGEGAAKPPAGYVEQFAKDAYWWRYNMEFPHNVLTTTYMFGPLPGAYKVGEATAGIWTNDGSIGGLFSQAPVCGPVACN